MAAVIYNTDPVAVVGGEMLARLKDEAVTAPLRRARFCLHHSPDDRLHEMLIVFCRDSLVRPHRHTDKSESFHVVEGRLTVVLFDDDGKPIRRIPMAPPGQGLPFLYRVDGPIWHSLILESEYVSIHEVTNGPFRAADGDFPAWAPEEPDALRRYMTGLGVPPVTA